MPSRLGGRSCPRHTHTHTHTHARTHARTHAHTRIHAHTRLRSHARTHTYTRTFTLTHTYTQDTHTHTHTHKHTHTTQHNTTHTQAQKEPIKNFIVNIIIKLSSSPQVKRLYKSTPVDSPPKPTRRIPRTTLVWQPLPHSCFPGLKEQLGHDSEAESRAGAAGEARVAPQLVRESCLHPLPRQ